ncbi:MAG TPA: hypothetical protein VLB03_11785, partial [Nocardioidaceae bacterium]|nr:hypothetical protein [Nocardioidaceae bacterium]
MKHRQLAGDLGEPDVVPLLGGPERGGDHVVQLEIRLQLGLVEVVARLSHLLCVEQIVPGFDRDRRAFLCGDRLHVRRFLFDPSHSRRPDP